MNTNEKPYIVQETISGDIWTIWYEDILNSYISADSGSINTKLPFLHLPWARNDAKYTMYLPSKISEPKEGIISKIESEWCFISCQNKSHKGVLFHPLKKYLILSGKQKVVYRVA